MDRFAHAVILSWGWRRRGIAFAAGALSALAQPPFFAFPLLWLTFPVLVWLIDGAVASSRSGRVRRLLPAFATGWWFGFGYFLAGLWWIGSAFLVEADKFGWLMPFAVIAGAGGSCALLGLRRSAGAASLERGLAAHLRARPRARRRRVGARHLFTGFPLELDRLRADGGRGADAVGLSLRPLCAEHDRRHRSSPRRRRSHPPAPGGSATVVSPRWRSPPSWRSASTASSGCRRARLRFVPDTIDAHRAARARPAAEMGSGEQGTVVWRPIPTSARPPMRRLQPGTILVWPESSFPYALTEEPGALAAIGDLLPAGTTLVTGAYRAEYPPSGRAARLQLDLCHRRRRGDPRRLRQGAPRAVRRIRAAAGLASAPAALRQFAEGGFSAGDRRRRIPSRMRRSFSPLICYEAIFPARCCPTAPRPGFMVNVTNDGWFGRTIGPYQHFHQARVRAVEEGLPMVQRRQYRHFCYYRRQRAYLCQHKLGREGHDGVATSGCHRTMGSTLRWRVVQFYLLLRCMCCYS